MPDNDVAEWDPTQYESDPRPSDEVAVPGEERTAIIRNSDRVLFRRCRRRWGWNSHLRGNIGPRVTATPLWLGSGFHFALEDYHGYKVYQKASTAFLAFVEATRRHDRKGLPPDYQDHISTATEMLDYYTDLWLIGRDPLTTFVYNGVPQVEVNFRITIPWEAGRYGYDRVVYSGTIDRISIDSNGLLWVVEYKTAKQIFTMHFAMDGQISSYVWAARHLYGLPVAGVIYQQHRKSIPKQPDLLGSGKFSTKKNMLTTHRHYRQALIGLYGSVARAPIANVDYLNDLVRTENEDRDIFVRRDRVFRNEHQCQAEGAKILMEIEEMLNPDLPLYPNPTRECAFMCPFSTACVNIDDGSDWMSELQMTMQPRERVYDKWRESLELPKTIELLANVT